MFRFLQQVTKPQQIRWWSFALLGVALCGATLFALRSSMAAGALNQTPRVTPANPIQNAATLVSPATAVRIEDQQQGCTVNCGATVPTNGQTNTAVSFAANATTQGCSTQPTYSWDFGDGSAVSTQQNPSKTYTAAGTYNWRLTTTVSSGGTNIDTVIGGLGEGAPAKQSPYLTPFAVAADPQNRGVYVLENAANSTVIRFINTTNQSVTIGGRTIEAGINRVLVGNGTDELGENVAGTNVSLADANGVATHPNGNLLYFVVQNPPRVRAFNLSASNQTVGSRTIAPGNVGTLAEIAAADTLNALAVNASGDVFVASPVTGINRVYRINAAGTVSNFAGNGASTKSTDAFTAGPATGIALLQPRALEVDPNGNVYIADASHQRVIRVDTNGAATLVNQFAQPEMGQGVFPCGLAFFSGSLYVALGNQQTIVRVAAGQAPVRVAGVENMSCDYSSSNCGDGGSASNAGLFIQGSSGNPPFTHIDANANGLVIPDQGAISRGRVRFINLSSASVTLAGTTVAAMNINTIAGNGLLSPYDGVAANATELRINNGLAIDPNNNFWLTDSSSGRLRFVNRGNANVTLFANTAAQQIVPAGAIVTVNKDVGTGQGDNTTANQMFLNTPQGIFATSQGLYIVETLGAGAVGTGSTARKTGRIRFLNTTGSSVTLFAGSSSSIAVPAGNVTTIAGGGQDPSNIGNGGFALSAKFVGPSDIVVASNGDIYIADTGNKAIRKVAGGTGIVTSLNVPASDYTGLALGAGRLYATDNDGNKVLRETAANSGTFETMSSDPLIYRPRDLAVDGSGNAYVLNAAATPTDSNANAHRLIRLTSTGSASVYAGTTVGYSGDGGPANAAKLNIYSAPVILSTLASNVFADTTINVVTNSAGEVFFSDIGNGRIRRIAAGEASCTSTGTITITGGDNPPPVLTSITPNVRGAGTQAFTLTATGSSFIASSTIRWNGTDRPTTFVNATQLTAQIPATDVANAGTAQVTVFTPTPGGGTSSPQAFTIQALNPVPTINTIVPNTITVNTAFRLTVNGNSFTPTSTIRWEGQSRATTFVNDTQLTAQIPASDVASVGNYDVSVFTPEPGGGSSSAARFIVTATNPAPTIGVLSPHAVAAGGQPFTLTVNGSGFAFGSVVRWNGQDRPTTFLSTSALTIAVSAADIATANVVPITVFSPTPGGGVTAAANFIVGTAATGVSAASYVRDLAGESIVALFGVGMATGVKIADTVPLPTTLEGTTIMVRDSLGVDRPAPLFFVAPSQINFLIPAGTANGIATLVIRAGDGKYSVATPNIETVSPALFTANASGTGPVSAVALRVKADGSLVYEETARLQNGQIVNVPIDLGPASEQVFIIAFGTGLRGHSVGTQGTATLGGLNLPSLYAGPQGALVGLDQINLGPVSRELIGRGTVDLVFRLDGKTANTVTLSIK